MIIYKKMYVYKIYICCAYTSKCIVFIKIENIDA